MNQSEIEQLRKKGIYVTNQFEFIPVSRNGKIGLESARVIECYKLLNLFGERETKKEAE